MLGIYFSGTGNTKHCIEKLTKLLDASAQVVPLEAAQTAELIGKNDTILLGYPIQFSNAPYFVRTFIKEHASLWKNKKVLCVATMGAFSGDGAGCTARLLKRYGAKILGGLHLKMPDSVCDSKLLKKRWEQNHQILIEADQKIEKTAKQILQGHYPKEGLSIFCRIAGLFGQRLWFYSKTAGYTDKLHIHDSCNGCGMCVSLCPLKNITLQNQKAAAGAQCTMCYRCISHCPQKAITLLGKEVVEQIRYEND